MDVYGIHEGRTAHRTYLGHIGIITALPCVLAALWEMEERFSAQPGGVYAAERLLTDPQPFIDELMGRGLEIFSYPRGLN